MIFLAINIDERLDQTDNRERPPLVRKNNKIDKIAVAR